MTGDRFSRRTLLASIGSGVATLVAGCGYQPAAGELDWIKDVGNAAPAGPGFGSIDDQRWLCDGTHLYRVRNRENVMFSSDGTAVTAYDSAGEIAWEGEDERYYEGVPAVADGRVYLSFETGSVAAFERDDSSDDARSQGASGSDDAVFAWTTRHEGAPLALSADAELVVGARGDELVGFDAATGENRFSLSLSEDLGIDPIDDSADDAIDGNSATDEEPTEDDASEDDATDDESADETTDDPVDAIAVAGERAWILVADELRAVDGDGTVVVERSLPSAGEWLAATDAGAVLAIADELWVIDPAGDRPFSTEIDEAGTPAVVEEADRLYHAGRTGITAIDVDDGSVAWEESYSLRGGPVADREGCYGLGSADGSSGCELFALTNDGETRWGVPAYEEIGCSSDLFLVGDRLVVVRGDTMYGFRKELGNRYTIL